MTAPLILFTIFSHIIFPIFLLFIISNNKAKNLALYVSLNFFTVTFLLMINKAGSAWYWFGSHWPLLYIVAWFGAVYLYYKKGHWKQAQLFPKGKFISLIAAVLLILISLFNTMSIPQLYGNFIPKGESLTISPPLGTENVVVIHGGSGDMQNNHLFKVQARVSYEQYQEQMRREESIKKNKAYKDHNQEDELDEEKVNAAQKYAIDFSKLNNFGLRANGIYPSDLSKYAIYGSNVLAPCNGQVIGIESSIVDNNPPKMDYKNFFGNYILLHCSGNTVVLAHLKKNSARVVLGQEVKISEIIANVGNSGESTEPHLHIHAVKGIEIDIEKLINDAHPIPLIINERFLIRNDKL